MFVTSIIATPYYRGSSLLENTAYCFWLLSSVLPPTPLSFQHAQSNLWGWWSLAKPWGPTFAALC